MRKLAILTTAAVAVVATFGAAQADTATTPAATASAASGNDVGAAILAYASFHSDVSDLRTAQITSPAALDHALDAAARHNAADLTRGWIAYGGSTAAQSSEFVAGVRAAAAYYGREQVINAIAADPYYARSFRGARDAERLALQSANADGARVMALADRYQELAYSLQRRPWANAVSPGQAARVQHVRALGEPGAATLTLAANLTPRLAVTPASLQPASDPTSFGGRRFWDAVGGGADVSTVAAQTGAFKVNVPRGEALYRMTSVAALQALNASDAHATQISMMLNDPRSKDCFEMAQLQLYQCLSAAHFRYENAFCLGEHGLRGMGKCISALADPDSGGAAIPATASTAATSTARRED